ncbi:MAG: sodium:proton antiporter [Shewanellaceae bacterium]|nr:sodium:proton antiporter [Shewanellaceae bacterium]
MNAVAVSVIILLILSVLRLNIIIALSVCAIIAGLISGMTFDAIIAAFNAGLGDNAKLALTYAMLGIFAAALASSGITDIVSYKIINRLNQAQSRTQNTWIKLILVVSVLLMAIASQNIIPVHIAFIPILIPPLLMSMSMLQLDRRLMACIMTFGLVATYMILPFGYGHVFLNSLLKTQLSQQGLEVTTHTVLNAMLLPFLGMLFGLAVAVFLSYRRPRRYQIKSNMLSPKRHSEHPSNAFLFAGIAVSVTFGVQLLYQDAMIMAALAGYVVLKLSGVLKGHLDQDIISQGINMMASIAFIMIAAAGFAGVIQATGHIDLLVQTIHLNLADHQGLAAFLMLLTGLLITMGIGSSFSTLPLIAAIYVPLAASFGFSIPATVALIGTAAALGDAGSPASESTLAPTMGLNADEQHDHIRDSVIPTFIHFNLPLLAFGWFAAMTL